MKLMLSLLCFTFLNTQCATKNINDLGTTSDDKNAIFEYKYYTRGFYKEHHISEEKIITYLDYKKEKFVEKKITPLDWAKCLELLTQIDFDGFENLNAPSGLRHTDKVQHAELTLKINNSTFKSRAFDHGNPPKDLKSLVDHLLYLSE